MVNRQRDRSSRCSSVALLAPAPLCKVQCGDPPGPRAARRPLLWGGGASSGSGVAASRNPVI